MDLKRDCKGCRSADSSPPYSYHKCVVYAHTITNVSFEEFRDKYCPCVNCIVKVICPNSYKFYTPGKRCDLILQARQEVATSKDQLIQNNIVHKKFSQ